MTVMVDAAVWRWQDGRWAHMASDSSLEELHTFAARLGLPRVGFHGDHYDVDERTRTRAIRLGALETDPRRLVGCLRRAGMRRRRTATRRWNRVDHMTPATAEELPAELGRIIPSEVIAHGHLRTDHLLEQLEGPLLRSWILTGGPGDWLVGAAVADPGGLARSFGGPHSDAVSHVAPGQGRLSVEVFTAPPP